MDLSSHPKSLAIHTGRKDYEQVMRRFAFLLPGLAGAHSLGPRARVNTSSKSKELAS
jgi:hypothetical protein